MKRLLILFWLGVCAYAQTARYPGATATDADLGVAANRVSTRLSSAIGAADTTLHVQSAARIVPNVILTLRSSNSSTLEYVWACSVSGTTITLGRTACPSTDGRGIDGTTAVAHAQNETVEANINAWYQKSLAAEIKALEQNIVGSSNYNSANYDFSQAPGGSLIAGNNAVTLAPVPAGVNATDSGHYLLVTGGTGSTEPCLITGGSGTAGQSSGQVIINCAGTHSGAWTIRSASGGLQEAILANASQIATIGVPNTITVYAPIVFPQYGVFTIQGGGLFSYQIVRATSFTSGDIFHHTTAANVTIRGFLIDNGQNNPTGAGSAIFTYNSTGSGINLGPMTVENVTIVGGQYQIFCDSCRALTLTNVSTSSNGQAYEEDGVRLACSNTSIQLGLLTFTSSYLAGKVNGVHVLCADGLSAIGGGASGQVGWLFDGTGTRPIGHVSVIGAGIDGPSVAGIKFQGNSTVRSTIHFVGGYIDGEYGISPVSNVGVNFASGSWEDISITGMQIKNLGSWGVQSVTATGAKNLNLKNNDIVETAQVNDGITGGIYFGAAQTGWHVVGNTVGNSSIAGHSGNGILLGGDVTLSVVTGNDFRNNTNPIELNGHVLSGVIEANLGIDDNVAQTIASANTITLGPNPMYTITGSTVIKTMNGGYAGRKVRLAFNDGSPAGVDATGNFYYAKTVTQNQQIECTHDGTKWGCVGP